MEQSAAASAEESPVGGSDVESRLDALEAEGARSFDAPACDCVRTLLARADELGGSVGNRLRDRAAAHLDALSQHFAKERVRIQQTLTVVEKEHGELLELRRKAERGELTSVARTLRRLRTGPKLVRPASQPSAAPTTGAAIPGRVVSPLASRKRRVVAYEDSVAQMVATLALARATDVVPSDAGPYNPLRIASDVLDRMRNISPFYLAVQLNRLEELGSLLGLPELPPPPAPEKKVLPKRKGPAKR